MWSLILSSHYSDSEISRDFPANITEHFPCVSDINQ